MLDAARLTKICLRTFVISIVVSTALAVVAIATPDNSWFHDLKILATVGTVVAASICGLACGGCLQRGQKILPIAGLILAAISSTLILSGIWVDVDSEAYWKTTLSVGCFAVACAHLAMLLMTNLAGFYRWAYIIAYQLVFGLAALLAIGVSFELYDESQNLWRATGVVAVLVGAISLLIPIFHYLSRSKIQELEEAEDPLLVVENEIARIKSRLVQLEQKRDDLLRQEPNAG